MNYSIPVYKPDMNDEIIGFYKKQLNGIIDQQIMISQLSMGITYSDTENMDEYERSYIFAKLIKLKKDEIEAKQKALENSKNNRR